MARPRSKLETGVAPDGPAPGPKPKRGRTMEMDSEFFIGLDTSKSKMSVVVADGGRNGDVLFWRHTVGAVVSYVNGRKAGETGPSGCTFVMRPAQRGTISIGRLPGLVIPARSSRPLSFPDVRVIGSRPTAATP